MDIEDTDIKFVKDKRYAMLDDYAIIGDVHLGFEQKMNEGGYNVPLFSKKIEEDILEIKSKKLIMLGDIKEEIVNVKPYDRFKIRDFFHRISNKFEEVIITKGNHDANLEKIINDKNILIKNEFVYKNFLFLHGHRIPNKEDIKRVDTICAAHIHPSVKLFDKNGVVYKEDCWLLCDFNLPEYKFGTNKIKYLIVFPTFNRFLGGHDDYEEIKSHEPWFLKYIEKRRKLTTSLTLI